MPPAFEFSDADWATYVHSLDIPDLNDWMRLQVSRGQGYYLSRLKRLQFNGGRVLDAGCGIGNWSIALAYLFDEVVAVENDSVRLGVVDGMLPFFKGKMKTALASVDVLPFEDASFDAVFCNGVIFLTEYRKVLSEFARVLKPGGMLYFTYNGKGWWRHLIHDRGPSEPVCVMYGANGIISRYFMLLDEIPLERFSAAINEMPLQNILLEHFPSDGLSWPFRRRVQEAYAKYLSCDDHRLQATNDFALKAAREGLARMDNSPREKRRADNILSCLHDLLGPTIPEQYGLRVARDLVSRIALGRSDYIPEIHTYAHEPEEMTEELVRQGFHSIQSALEGCLCLDHDIPPVAPINARKMGVFESVARR